MSIQETITQLTDKMNQEPEGIQGIEAVYQFDVEDSGIHQVRLTEGSAEYRTGEEWTADCILTMKEANFTKLSAGDLDPTTAFITGKLKVKGNLSLAVRLQSLFAKYR
ncbi:putative sterol carrier protein [Kroppenstedtia sanguinis]|uniref:SCP2 sterol-binding domain-containing protein n=1 Tax=Kroppenstedtia sanguinis TaxID=1380684 RepID=A0ABW4C737_9BACL